MIIRHKLSANIYLKILFHGIPCPVISFGENDLFTQPRNPPESRLRRYQNAIQKIISFAPVPFFGRLFVLPHQKPIKTVGKISFDANSYYLFQAHLNNSSYNRLLSEYWLSNGPYIEDFYTKYYPIVRGIPY